jgi:hypothetical protein
MASQINLDWVRKVKAKYEALLLSKKHVVGIGIGFKEKDGQTTDQMALVVSVSKKIPVSEIGIADRIPTELEGVPLDVKEVGEIRALD